MAGLSPEYRLVMGTGHGWQSWTRDLARRKVWGSPGPEMGVASGIEL